MSDSHSDALVFFGATGDLAYKKIFPALQAMIKRGHLNVPVIGVAKAGWNLEQLRARSMEIFHQHQFAATSLEVRIQNRVAIRRHCYTSGDRVVERCDRQGFPSSKA